jgi:hypothetical protein
VELLYSESLTQKYSKVLESQEIKTTKKAKTAGFGWRGGADFCFRVPYCAIDFEKERKELRILEAPF